VLYAKIFAKEVLTMNLGERLRFLRDRRELSREELANKLGIAYGTYSKYELGSREPDYETIKRIASFFGVSIDYLLGYTDSPLNADDNIKDLPRIAKVEIEDFIEFIKNKYKKRK
jgi:transcriptional regulator with XRE-family HTH domain